MSRRSLRTFVFNSGFSAPEIPLSSGFGVMVSCRQASASYIDEHPSFSRFFCDEKALSDIFVRVQDGGTCANLYHQSAWTNQTYNRLPDLPPGKTCRRLMNFCKYCHTSFYHRCGP
ncbi:uncharacterized protein BT62DRAFT_467424 [Guyanagaster necrorhizus]|uniref:Uncharacterized protein n=1 Tax=Guyanagaster necrorhizus TaxID=856835 RepID=A0A9P7VL18_9AGAR|nr:uncharacterized protein BT62DRAFT_467424 [Guyanagaster necrorhizus MCA 3950]KAG7441869.1 hypothetical protein BT62DRAFT_467424 [Guyanagaster necrorhizus MCA 3950]